MNCQNCGYTLWNLKTRNCPECGEAFKPSEFEFVANAVQYCCPDCDQAYYGTTLTGHLRPAEFDCVNCGRKLHMDDMVLRPAKGIGDDQTQRDVMPWLERRRRNPFMAWIKTIGRSMVGPGKLMRAVPTSSTPMQACWYATVTLTAILFCGGGAPFSIVGLIAYASGDRSMDMLPGAGVIFF